MTLAFSLRRLLSALCKNLSRCLKITRGWSHKRGLGEVLTNFPIVAHPESTLLSSVDDVLLNTHKTDQDLGPTVRWHSEVLLVFNLPLIHFLPDECWMWSNIKSLLWTLIDAALFHSNFKRHFEEPWCGDVPISLIDHNSC